MSFVGNAFEAVVTGGLGYMVGGVYHGRRAMRKADPEVVLSPVCLGCGEEYGQWGPILYPANASRYEQQRACKGCGLVQRRGVPR